MRHDLRAVMLFSISGGDKEDIKQETQYFHNVARKGIEPSR